MISWIAAFSGGSVRWLLGLLLVCAGGLHARAQAPTITSFSPSSGPVGTTVVINGTNFTPPISISFTGNASASGSFTSTTVMATVPSGAQSGPITITTSHGSAITATGFTVGASSAHPPFFTGESALSNGIYYLAFPSGNYFGYYSYLSNPAYIFHFDLGYEYVFDANDGNSGVYLYDFASDTFFYSSPSFPFPYLYDFTRKSTLYYYPDTTSSGHYTANPRFFYDFGTGTIITK